MAGKCRLAESTLQTFQCALALDHLQEAGSKRRASTLLIGSASIENVSTIASSAQPLQEVNRRSQCVKHRRKQIKKTVLEIGAAILPRYAITNLDEHHNSR